MPLPHLTPTLPGTGGRLRREPADFTVIELPSYEPAGTGSHAYLQVEKRGITTHEAVRRVARALDVAPRDIGYAGLKDAHAVAVQTLSVEHVDPDEAARLLEEVSGLRVISASRHKNKLRLGHLRGNRFEIVIRDVVPDAARRAQAILGELTARGSPNWFGEQRFGNRGDNHVLGRLLVLGDSGGVVDHLLGGIAAGSDSPLAEACGLYRDGDLDGALEAMPQRAPERRMLGQLIDGRSKRRVLGTVPRRLQRLYVSAYQSWMFNRILEQRLPDLGTLEEGDLAYLHDRGAVFRVEDPVAEQPRADALEISPSGPLFGRKTTAPGGEPGARESALLEEEGLTPAHFRVRGCGTFQGERRPLRVAVGDADVSEVATADGEPPAIRVRFELPRGSFATALLNEITKNG